MLVSVTFITVFMILMRSLTSLIRINKNNGDKFYCRKSMWENEKLIINKLGPCAHLYRSSVTGGDVPVLSSMAECVNAYPVQEKDLTDCIPHFSISFPSLDCVCLSTSECGVWRGRSGCVRLFSQTGTRGPSDQASLGIISLFPGLPCPSVCVQTEMVN